MIATIKTFKLMQDYVLSILIITKGMWQTLTETSQMEGAVEEINT